MSSFHDIDRLSTPELHVLLTTPPERLSDEQSRSVADFIHRIGGFENAMLALAALETLERAA